MNLLKLSLTISLIGIFIILSISSFYELPLQKIKDLNENQLETKVKISGTLLSIKETPGLYLLKITDNTATIPIVIFKEETLNLNPGQKLEIQGTLTEYNHELEILAEIITEKTE